jgi:hypothetical protein
MSDCIESTDNESEVIVISEVSKKEMMTSIFDDDLIEKYNDKEGNPR